MLIRTKKNSFFCLSTLLWTPRLLEENIFLFFSTSRACSECPRDVMLGTRELRGENLTIPSSPRGSFASTCLASSVASSAVFCQTLLALAQPRTIRVRHTIVARDRLARRPHGPNTFRVLEKEKVNAHKSSCRLLDSITSLSCCLTSLAPKLRQ